ncbi:MAG: ferredoxin [Candidatus Bathyarchaeota archaeon B26-2]|nr:MAG: ferredoxin [Candidatus Bathyarchaeota archaeon B26-2]
MRLRLIYSPSVVEKPILATVILKTGVTINILEAKVDAQRGELVVSIPTEGESLQRVIEMFQDAGVEVQLLTKTLQIDLERCTSCGACISPCPTKALRFRSDWTIDFDEERCVACRVCVKACPVKAISIP